MPFAGRSLSLALSPSQLFPSRPGSISLTGLRVITSFLSLLPPLPPKDLLR